MVGEGVGSVNLANATLETYFQGPQFSCFLCHNTGGSTSGKTQYPGKDINISHVILGSIPATSPTPTLTPGDETAPVATTTAERVDQTR